MVFEEGNGTVEGMLRYNSDLFEAETVRRMVGHFLTLLEGVADDPDRRLSGLPWLTEAERRLVLRDWNETDVDFPQELCLHHLFERQAARTPEAIAHQRRRRPADLRRAGGLVEPAGASPAPDGDRPRDAVALYFERSPEMIAADPRHAQGRRRVRPARPGAPAERLRLVLADTRPRRAAHPASRCGTGLPMWKPRCSASTTRSPIAEDDGASRPPESGVRSDDLAYVIYTSGSTGRPKGVMVEHRAIGNTIQWRDRDLTVHADDVVLYNLPYTFDPSLRSSSQRWRSGARMVLAAPGEEYDPHRLLERVVGKE